MQQAPSAQKVARWLVCVLFLMFANCASVKQSCNGCQRKLNPRVVFSTPSNKALTVNVEMACTPDERQRGLMYRKEMAADKGMLFVFPQATEQSFWMKNTYIALDMIHIDAKKKIVGIVENAKPHTTTSRTVGKPALYVLEVNAFFARKHGIKAGDQVKFVDIPYCAQ